MPATVLTDLALALSRRPVTTVDPLRYLAEAAGEIVRALQVNGAVLVVPDTGWVGGSDDTATLVGEIQQRDGHGPLSTAVRTTRPMLTPDLTRIGPPALAALAADAGFTSSAALALLADDRVVAALQLIGRVGCPVETWHVDALAPVLHVLGARITDMVEVARMRRAPALTPPPLRIPVPVGSPRPQPVGIESRDAVLAQPLPPVPVARQDVVRPERIGGLALESDPLLEGSVTSAPRPLGEAPPELVTDELRHVLPLPRRPEHPQARHRSDG